VREAHFEQAGEKRLGKKAMSANVEFEKQEVRRLIALMKSPGYWRDRDPEVVRAVRTGFQRLYGRSVKPATAAQRASEVQTAA
jgi:hypothetical protein